MAEIRAREIIDRIEEHFPKGLALEWDNPGLLCGSRDKTVKKVMIALDCTDKVVDEAVEKGCDLVLTHHPLIFGSIKAVNDESFIGRRLIKLIKNDISLYAMHTNFDVAKEGMGHIVAERFGAAELSPMEVTGEMDGEAVGIGFYGKLEVPMGARELSSFIKDRFGIEGVVYYDAGKPISTIAVCPGSGRGMLKFAKELSADALITGDMGHHDGIDAVAEGISLIDPGHYGLEHIFSAYMAGFLNKGFPELETFCCDRDPRGFI